MRSLTSRSTLFALGVAVIGASLALGCQKKNELYDASSDSESNLAESALAVAASIANDSESAAPGFLGEEKEALPAIGSGRPYSTCSLSSARSSCGSNGVATVNWGSCTAGNVELSGGWTNAYNQQSTCNTLQGGSVPTSGLVTRTMPTGLVVTYASGATLTTDTQSHAPYVGPTLPSTGITTTFASGSRSVTIDGLHRVLRGPGGAKWFDHSLTGGLTITGARSMGTRVVSGSVTVYHNLAKVTATHVFNGVTWGYSNCVHPTSGSIQTSLSSGATTRVTFTATCGVATFTSTTGSVGGLTLSMTE